jgi:hypothetical protein
MGATRMFAPQPFDSTTPASRHDAPSRNRLHAMPVVSPGERSFLSESNHARKRRAIALINASRSSSALRPTSIIASATAIDICVSSVNVPGG